jgi:hypothetical protein
VIVAGRAVWPGPGKLSLVGQNEQSSRQGATLPPAMPVPDSAITAASTSDKGQAKLSLQVTLKAHASGERRQHGCGRAS